MSQEVPVRHKVCDDINSQFIESFVRRYRAANFGAKACDAIQNFLRPHLVRRYKESGVVNEPLRAGDLLIDVRSMTRTSFDSKKFIQYLIDSGQYEFAVERKCLRPSSSDSAGKVTVRLSVDKSKGPSLTTLISFNSERKKEYDNDISQWSTKDLAKFYHRAKIGKKAFQSEEAAIKQVMSSARMDQIIGILGMEHVRWGPFTLSLSWKPPLEKTQPSRVDKHMVKQVFGEEIFRQYQKPPVVTEMLYVETGDERYFRQLAILRQKENSQARGFRQYDDFDEDGPDIF